MSIALRAALSGAALFLLWSQPNPQPPARGPIPMRSPGAGPWFVPVPDHQPLAPGEHPRLLFRSSRLPELRRRAATPEGRAILTRLEQLLAGPPTVGHPAGHCFLYHLTSEPRHALAARDSWDRALAGERDRDPRYSFRTPGGALRAGPSLGWLAVGYDLCYPAWDPATRERIGRAIAEYAEPVPVRGGQAPITLHDLARGTMPPGSNHFSMQIGGAALALLAVSGEPWADQPRIDASFREVENSLVRNLSEGFGDGGFFAEGDGTGSMASQIVYLAALDAWRNARGRDYSLGPRPNVRMMVLKWIYQTLYLNGQPRVWPIRGGYPHNVWARTGLSGAAYFAQGFPHVRPDERAAMKWTYDRFLRATDEATGTPFDTASLYPQFAIASFLNWPLDTPAADPNRVLPHAYRDAACDFFCWRNRWQDSRDTVITLLTTQTRGYMGAKPDSALHIHSGDRQLTWGTVPAGPVRDWHMDPRGLTSSLTLSDGTVVGVDLTGTSGVDVLLVTTGPAEGSPVRLGSTTLTLYSPSTPGPLAAKTDRTSVRLGQQRISLANGRFVFSRRSVSPR